MDNNQKRESVKKNYDLIAKQYSQDFGSYIEDMNIYTEFEKYLHNDTTILDLGSGSGRACAYFINKGYNIIGYDFSSEMKKYAYELHGEFPYIVDDMVNLKTHFSDSSVDSVFAMYSLFHLPTLDLEHVIANISDILKDDGIFLFSYQIGSGEEMADEPYLDQLGKNVLYMNYHENEEINNLIKHYHFSELFRFEKIETSDVAINNNDIVTAYLILKKCK